MSEIRETAKGIKYKVEPDLDPDISWLDQTDDEMGKGFEAGAKARKAAYYNDEWSMVGLIYVDEDGGEIGSVWSIEDDSDLDLMADYYFGPISSDSKQTQEA